MKHNLTMIQKISFSLTIVLCALFGEILAIPAKPQLEDFDWDLDLEDYEPHNPQELDDIINLIKSMKEKLMSKDPGEAVISWQDTRDHLLKLKQHIDIVDDLGMDDDRKFAESLLKASDIPENLNECSSSDFLDFSIILPQYHQYPALSTYLEESRPLRLKECIQLLSVKSQKISDALRRTKLGILIDLQLGLENRQIESSSDEPMNAVDELEHALAKYLSMYRESLNRPLTEKGEPRNFLRKISQAIHRKFLPACKNFAKFAIEFKEIRDGLVRNSGKSKVELPSNIVSVITTCRILESYPPQINRDRILEVLKAQLSA